MFLSWSIRRYSDFHLDQNTLDKYCTLCQRRLQYRSSRTNSPGGGDTTLDLKTSNWLGDRGCGESALLSSSHVSDLLLTMASASVMKVLSNSWSNCCSFLSSSAVNTCRTDRIIRSHTHPMWDEYGTFMSNCIQSQFSFQEF